MISPPGHYGLFHDYNHQALIRQIHLHLFTGYSINYPILNCLIPTPEKLKVSQRIMVRGKTTLYLSVCAKNSEKNFNNSSKYANFRFFASLSALVKNTSESPGQPSQALLTARYNPLRVLALKAAQKTPPLTVLFNNIDML